MKQIMKLLVFASMVCYAKNATARTDEQAIRQLVTSGTVIFNDEKGNRLLEIDGEKRYIPASTIKVLTSLVALKLLGEDYHFKTKFFTNSRGELAIKGYGDPFLVSDEIRLIAQKLQRKGIITVTDIVLDESAFVEDLAIPGIATTTNPYDALNGALLVNFNTINIAKDPAGTVRSGEKETPLTPMAIAKARTLKPGATERVNLSAQRLDCFTYAGELFAVLLREQGITVRGDSVRLAVVDSSWRCIYTHYNTRALSEVIAGLLKYSNNFIANQLFLTIGLEKRGGEASLKKSAALFKEVIASQFPAIAKDLTIVEGSGISRSTQITGIAMAAVMEQFKPYGSLLTPKKGHPVKSGTLTGAYNYTGYIKTEMGLRSFVILLNQSNNNRDAIFNLLQRYGE